MNLGFGEIVIIIFAALLFFGPSKLPEFGKSLGVTLREFKKATQGLVDDGADQDREKKKVE
ncbi:sec-independent protein translocase protein TatA [Bacillus pakistanensis]|uniref:Sec-independent protein translocase protein TatA n=1 Tax=Rossellomorea pakistanensis TaxID=992288 RepID=A0ABS2NIL6_9BACI|nr:twin-arginine translocase TatA/TatE family subunit [Bacillus pakistanensis]MBM7587715.1 sec-independent protein translocase protein TatA [Bacillus pakistanensis]